VPRPTHLKSRRARVTHCVAVVRAGRSGSAGWRRCPRRVLPGTHFCPSHRDAIDGCVLGWRQYRDAEIAARA
jgi:hypothetical protein